MQNRNKLEINGVDRGSKTRYGKKSFSYEQQHCGTPPSDFK